MRTALIILAAVYVAGCYAMAYFVGKAEAANGKAFPRLVRGIVIVLWPVTLILLPGFVAWHAGTTAKVRAKAKADAASRAPQTRGRK